MDLIIGKRGTNVNLLTLYERTSKFGIAKKIIGKEVKSVNAAL
jgi:IS30 family transposase